MICRGGCLAKLFKKYSEYDYPSLAMVSINSAEETNIGKVVESLDENNLRILLMQMSGFAAMSYQDLLDKYGSPPNDGDPFIAILGTEELPVRGTMKRFVSGPWVVMSMVKNDILQG